MSNARIALLPDRGIVSVTGEDAQKLLAGIITNEIDLLDRQPAIFAGLLSPQGKVLFDFLVVRRDGGYWLDVAREKADDLVKRLAMYRLRAKVLIENLSSQVVVEAAWGEAPSANPDATQVRDPREAGLGVRSYRPVGSNAATTPAGDYHAHRIALGVPEGGKDYDFGDAFPHEANFDLLDGVSFEKGCYVGQEIVARMQHRGTVRKRVVRVTGATELPASRPDVMIGDVVVGRLGSVAGKAGLALIRLDRAIEAIDRGLAITADGIGLGVDPEMIARQRVLMAAKALSP